jgi:superfamily II DNA or RNA helicase
MGQALDGTILFQGELRKEQKLAVLDLLQALKQPPFSTLGVMPCGFGKTVVALAVISQLGRKCCVVVHKSFLLQQWADRIATFLPAAKVACVCGTTKKEALEDLLRMCDIAVIMVQTLTRHPLHLDVFGALVVDECHHMAAQTFSRLFFRCPAQYVLGLSATPYRADGCTALLFWYLNGVGHKVEETDRAKEERMQVHCSTVPYSRPSLDRRETREPRNLMQEVQWIRRVLAQDPVRNALIISSLEVLLNKGHRVIVLSHRIDHLEKLRKLFTAEPRPSSAFYVGGQSASERGAAEEARVIFGTYQMASEGLDMPSLSALVFATPTGEIRQAVGRIMRPSAGKVTPAEVHDLADDSHPLLLRWTLKRQKFFRQLGASISQLDL